MRPGLRTTASALKTVGETLGARSARYAFEGRFAFSLGPGWTLVISPDDAGRFRVECLHGGRVRATMWAFAGDGERLAALALAARHEVAALAVDQRG